eukprot:11152280-Alexandrium_andersonii.AAC.1
MTYCPRREVRRSSLLPSLRQGTASAAALRNTLVLQHAVAAILRVRSYRRCSNSWALTSKSLLKWLGS